MKKEENEDSKTEQAIYVYCIAAGNKKADFGNMGLENNYVYSINYKDLSAIVHNCMIEPYKSEDKEKVKAWATTHEKVVEAALEQFGTVLPLGFDTIIKGEAGVTPEDNLINWIKDDYENLKQKIARVENKAEYGVQISWDPKIIGEKIIEDNAEIKRLNEEIKSKSKGLAFMYRQKLENLLKKEMEITSEKYFKDFYEKVKNCVDDIKIEKTKKVEDDRQMLLNLSCLLPKEKSRLLGDELEKINSIEGFFVRYTGPWPPYSFV
ncbi:MAG: GvpL/GvpF family gas vesicle protein [Actinomycetota bacterium]